MECDMTLTPSSWQSGATGLLRANDPDSLSRVAGLEFAAKAPAASWPTLTVRGGVQDAGALVITSNQTNDGTPAMFRTIAESILGAISIPGQSVPSITESETWDHNTLTYSGQFDLTMSRLTPAILLSLSATSLRMCSGTTTKRTTNGSSPTATITTTTSQPVTPKYVAYHTSGGYQVTALSGSSTNLTGMDQPWILVWFGSQSHWLDCTLPMNYSHEIGQGWANYPLRYAFQADAPLLLTFSANPTAITQDATAKGFDLTLPSGAKKISVMPLYGRKRLDAGTTNGWDSGAHLDSGAKTLIQAWYPRLQMFPASVAESYSYDPATDTATITEAVTWTTVLSSGASKFCPLPPVLGTALDTNLPGLSVSGTVVDGGVPTEYGPTQGIVGVDSYSWSMTGLAPFTEPRPDPVGTVPTALQSRIEAEVDKLIAGGRFAPWYHFNRLPASGSNSEVYWANPADGVALVAEAVPLVSSTRQTNLQQWLRDEQTARPLQSTYKATTGTERGPFGVYASYGDIYQFQHDWTYETRQWIASAWALARMYQTTGDAVSSSVVNAYTNAGAIIETDMANRDWATGYWFNGFDNRPRYTAVEQVNREWAGLAGLAWMSKHKTGGGEAFQTEWTIRCLLAKSTILRVAMAHLPRYQSDAGLITLPTDIVSLSIGPANDRWHPLLTSGLGYQTFVWADVWGDADDDPRQVVFLDQFQAFLDDSNCREGWQQNRGYSTSHIPAAGLTQPLANLLKAALGTEALVLNTKYRELQPHWHVPGATTMTAQEQNAAHPADQHALFLERAWIGGLDAATLQREAAYPWLTDGGDLFALSKMVEAARVASSAVQGQKFEISFQVATTATNTRAYDSTWNPAGVSVDVEFSDDGFSTSELMPAFWDRVVDQTVVSGSDHLVPSTVTQWAARYSPPRPGSWEWRVKQNDADLTDEIVIDATAFEVTADPSYHGRVQASATDDRYFEYEDGTPFVGRGYNLNSDRLALHDSQAAGTTLAAMGAAGVNQTRVWLDQREIIGLTGRGFALWAPASETYSDHFAYVTAATDPTHWLDDGGQQVVAYLESGYQGLFTDWVGHPIPCEPSTLHRIRARVYIPNALNGPADSGANSGKYGFVIKTEPSTWPIDVVTINGQTVHYAMEQASYGTRRSGDPIHTTTGGWVDVDAAYTSGPSEHWLPRIVLCVENATRDGVDGGHPLGTGQPKVYVKSIVVQRDNGDGTYGPNLTGQDSFDAWGAVDPIAATAFGLTVEQAEANGVYLDVMQVNKSDFYLAYLNDSGVLSNSYDEEHSYGSTTGTYQRYLAGWMGREFHGRYGYSRAIRAWQYVNEGSPDGVGSRHVLGFNDWAVRLRDYGNLPMLTTTTSNDAPRVFWEAATEADYITLHAYQPSAADKTATIKDTLLTLYTTADYSDSTAWIKAVADATDPNGSNGMGKPVVLDEGALGGDAEEPLIYTPVDASIPYWVGRLGGNVGPGGLTDIGEWIPDHTLYRTSPTYDHRPLFGVFGAWREQFPLNNGHYVDVAASSVTSGLQVIGQKDLTNHKFHAFVRNTGWTYKAVSDGGDPGWVPTGVSGSFTVSGLANSSDYTATWNDPTDGSLVTTQALISSGGGALTLTTPSALTTAVLVSVAPASGGGGGGVPTTVTYRVGASGDDGYDTSSGSFTNSGGVDFRLGDNGNHLSTYARFAGVTIPVGATITAAKLTLTDWWDESTAAGITTTIKAADTGNPSAPTDDASFTGASRTSQSASWTFGSGTNQTTGSTHDTADFASVIQHLVDNHSYASGSAVVLYLDWASETGARQLVFNSYDDDPTKAPLLSITYTVAAGTLGSVAPHTGTVLAAGGSAQRIDFVGNTTTWLSGAPSISPDAGSLGSVAVDSDTAAHAAYTPPGAAQTVTFTDSTDGNSTAVLSVVAAATSYTLSGPANGQPAAASSNFTVALTTSHAVDVAVTVTPSDSGDGGTFTPSTVSLARNTSAASATFTYTAASTGTKTISVSDNGGLSDPVSLSYAVDTRLLYDTFTGANDTHLDAHTPEIGGPWVTPTGKFAQWYTIQSNRADSTNIADSGVYADVGKAATTVTCTLTTTAGGNFMSIRGASSNAGFTGGWRVMLNRFSNEIQVYDPANALIATVTPAVAIGTGDYSVTVAHYRGHVRFQVGSEVVHGWIDDVLQGFGNAPTGTHLGPDWTSTNGGRMDDIAVTEITRAAAKHISVIGDSTSVFNRDNDLWPQRVAETYHAGVTRLVGRNLGGEGLSKGGSSGLTAKAQAQAIISNSDDPDYVFILIGTNDTPTDVAAATPNTVGALMNELLDTLTGGGIVAGKIRVLNTLMSADVAREAYNPANRIAIASSCSSRGVTCWDTSTWIDPTMGVDTSDGTHPNASGSAKIAAQVLGLLAGGGAGGSGHRGRGRLLGRWGFPF
jgi:lysophospholipase L1-like esterase